LLNRAHAGDGQAIEQLINQRVCPACGRTTLNVHHRPEIQTDLAACLYCGWARPSGVVLSYLPQIVLSQRWLLQSAFHGLRRLIRESILAGAAVEPGRFRAQVDELETVRFSRRALQSVLTPEDFKRIAAAIPRTTERKVLMKCDARLPASHAVVAFHVPTIPMTQPVVEVPQSNNDSLALS
jgi:hypothetical protein